MEYELLKFFATHPAKVFTREQLLSRVWGYEYYGGARTVDVHVRRLRAKLGEEHAEPDPDRALGGLPLRADPHPLIPAQVGWPSARASASSPTSQPTIPLHAAPPSMTATGPTSTSTRTMSTTPSTA